MAKYYVRYNDLQTQAASLQNISKTLDSFESRLNSISNTMDTRDSNMSTLKKQVKNYAKDIQTITNKNTSACKALKEVVEIYISAEKGNYYDLNNVCPPMTDEERAYAARLVVENTGILSSTEIYMLNKLIKDPTKTFIDILKEMEKIDLGKAGTISFVSSMFGVIQNFGKEKYYHGILDIIKYGGTTTANTMFKAEKVLGVKGTTAVGYVIDFFKNTYDNFNMEKNSTGRAVAETIGEAVVLAGTTYFASAAVTYALGSSAFAYAITGVAAIGATIGAPAIAVGVATVAVAGLVTFAAKKSLDWMVTGITGGEYDSAVEYISDTVLDTGGAIIDGAVGTAKKVISRFGSFAKWAFG